MCNSITNYEFIVYVTVRHFHVQHFKSTATRFQVCLFSAPEIFVPDVIPYEQPAPENTSRFMAPVSGACVMAVTLE